MKARDLTILLCILLSWHAEAQSGEVFITTDPEAAEIFVDSESKGFSPLLLSGIGPGELTIEARKGDYYGSARVRAAAGRLIKVHIQLSEETGRIFIRNAAPDLTVMLDGKRHGTVGDGLVENVPVGWDRLELTGNGVYAELEVLVEAGKTTIAEPEVYPVGSIRYALPENATALLTAGNLRLELTGSGLVGNVASGNAHVEVSRSGYVPASLQLEIKQGQTALLAPVLVPTEETAAQEVQTQIAESRRLTEAKRQELVRQLTEARERHAALTVTGWAFVSFGAVSFAGSITTGTLSCIDYFSQSKAVLRGTAVGLVIVSAISEAIGAMMLLERPDLEDMEDEIDQLATGGRR
ncbi:MAG: hypothetical protein JW852_09570 [Spirochaetales bacterium]|nr:hypothetical protein [Spirochaetales bacterium]